jgi:hypothetical protein
MTNEKAIELMKQRAAEANDNVMFDPATMEARIGGDGRYHVYRKNGATTLDHSRGIDDPRPSDLREALERINRRNAEFWKGRNGEQ